jgi:hypothetical protein
MRIGTSEPRAAAVLATSGEAPAAVAPAGVAPSGDAARVEGPSPFAQLLHGIGRQITAGEATMRNAARSARDMGPAELIALQAGVYRYSEAIDLASHLVDRATNGVKTVIQGNGQ